MQALYRLYRPQTFSDLIGQESISTTLLKGLQQGKPSHAYLFIGTRGTGKTSTARVLAKALNCRKATEGKWGEPCNECEACVAIRDSNYLDLIEIDAASNRGIDEIRDLREKIKLAPTQGKFKVYIIDEVHMLTNEAFNALLKTLEEPPAHAVFVLCTTDPQKIPVTIRSRCQVYEFKTPSLEEITKVLEKVSKEEGKEIKKEDLAQIAKKAKGAYRDALVLLEKYFISGEPEKDVDIAQLATLHLQKQLTEAITFISEAVSAGMNPKTITDQLLDFERKALLLLLGNKIQVEKEVSVSEFRSLEDFAKKANLATLKQMVLNLAESLEDFRFSPVPQLPLELALIKDFTVKEPAIITETVAVSIPTSVVSRPPVSEKEERPAQVGKPEVNVTEVKEETAVQKIEVKVGDTEVVVSTSTSGDLEKIRSQWFDLLRKLKPINHSLEALLRSSEPVDYKDGELTLRFSYRFHKERVEDAKNRATIEKVFHQETGMPIKLKLLLSDAPRPKKVQEAIQVEEENVKIVEDKDVQDAALDFFTN